MRQFQSLQPLVLTKHFVVELQQEHAQQLGLAVAVIEVQQKLAEEQHGSLARLFRSFFVVHFYQVVQVLGSELVCVELIEQSLLDRGAVFVLQSHADELSRRVDSCKLIYHLLVQL